MVLRNSSDNSDPGSQIKLLALLPTTVVSLEGFLIAERLRPFFPTHAKTNRRSQQLISFSSYFAHQLKRPTHVGFELLHQLLVAFEGTTRPLG